MSGGIDVHALPAIVNTPVKLKRQVRVVHQQFAVKVFFCNSSSCADVMVSVVVDREFTERSVNIQLHTVWVEGGARYLFIEGDGPDQRLFYEVTQLQFVGANCP